MVGDRGTGTRRGAVRKSRARSRLGSTAGSAASLIGMPSLPRSFKLNLSLYNILRRTSNWAWSSLIAVFLLFFLIFCAHYLLTSPGLVVTRVQVSGNTLLQADQVVRASGALGSNIFMVNTQQVVANLMAQKAVRGASVQLRLPQEVLISVEEREAAYIWKVGETMYAVSTDGYIIGTRKQVEGVIGIVDVDAIAVKQNDRLDPKTLAAARELWAVLPTKANIRPPYFEYSHTQGLILPHERGGRVIFGDAENLEAKVARLIGTLQQLEKEQKKAKMIDLRNIERPYLVY